MVQILLNTTNLEPRYLKVFLSLSIYHCVYSVSRFEIFFNEESTKELTDKYNLIEENIVKIGFENSANKYSQSDSARNGGDIGWVEESQLSEVIIEKIINLNPGEHSKIITLPGGFLIIKVNDIKKKKVENNFEEELKKFIIYEKNRQLNQFSIIYFNRIKQNSYLSEQ